MTAALRPGQDPAHPHCDLHVGSFLHDHRALLQLASLHRAAEVARFHWRRQHPALAPPCFDANEKDTPPPPESDSTRIQRWTWLHRERERLRERMRERERDRNAQANEQTESQSLRHAQRRDREEARRAAESTPLVSAGAAASASASTSASGLANASTTGTSTSTFLDGDPSSPASSSSPTTATSSELVILTGGDSDSESGSATDDAVISATLGRYNERFHPLRVSRYGRDPREPRNGQELQHRQRVQAGVPAESETEWQVWDRLVNDLFPGSLLRPAANGTGDPDDDERHWSARGTALSGIAVSFISQHLQTGMREASGSRRASPNVSLPHPIWSRRYKGAAGLWLRNELTRRSQAQSEDTARDGTAETSATAVRATATATALRPAGATANGANGSSATPGALSFPSLDPAQRQRSNTTADGPAATLQASSQQDWSSILLPANRSASETVSASQDLARAGAAAAALARTAESMDARLRVARMANAARRATASLGTADPGATSARTAATTRNGQRPRSTRGGMTVLDRLRELDGLLDSSIGSPLEESQAAPTDQRAAQSTNLAVGASDARRPSETVADVPQAGGEGILPSDGTVFDPDGANHENSGMADTSAGNVATALLDPDGECVADSGAALPVAAASPGASAAATLRARVTLRAEEAGRRLRNRSAQVMSDEGPATSDSTSSATGGAGGGDGEAWRTTRNAPTVQGWYLVPIASSAATSTAGQDGQAASLAVRQDGSDREDGGGEIRSDDLADGVVGGRSPVEAAASRHLIFDNPIRRTSPLPLSDSSPTSSNSDSGSGGATGTVANLSNISNNSDATTTNASSSSSSAARIRPRPLVRTPRQESLTPAYTPPRRNALQSEQTTASEPTEPRTNRERLLDEVLSEYRSLRPWRSTEAQRDFESRIRRAYNRWSMGGGAAANSDPAAVAPAAPATPAAPAAPAVPAAPAAAAAHSPSSMLSETPPPRAGATRLPGQDQRLQAGAHEDGWRVCR